jgi:alpha-beta hydrolase superfamily lysophospholipase
MEHREGTIPGIQDVKIYYQYWIPTGAPRAVLLLVHGLGDHSSRFQTFVEYFGQRGFVIAALDLPGHGKSGGIPGYIAKFSDFLADLNIFLKQVQNDFHGNKIFLVGHSIGGTIATAYLIHHQNEFAGSVLSAPVLKPGASITRLQIMLARLLSVLLPKIGVAPIEGAAVSRVPEVVQAYIHDPLVYHGKISARLGAELLKTLQRDLPPHLSAITLPLLILYGSEDRLSNPAGSQLLFESVKSPDKTIVRYDGLYHEIFNEPEKTKVYADMEGWLARHLQ